MNFWKEHAKLRFILILLFSVVGIVLTICGWTMTKQMAGLVIMMLGVGALLVALWLYNRPFADQKTKK